MQDGRDHASCIARTSRRGAARCRNMPGNVEEGGDLETRSLFPSLAWSFKIEYLLVFPPACTQPKPFVYDVWNVDDADGGRVLYLHTSKISGCTLHKFSFLVTDAPLKLDLTHISAQRALELKTSCRSCAAILAKVPPYRVSSLTSPKYVHVPVALRFRLRVPCMHRGERR
jgi:hypothetical protein